MEKIKYYRVQDHKIVEKEDCSDCSAFGILSQKCIADGDELFKITWGNEQYCCYVTFHVDIIFKDFFLGGMNI